MLSPTDCTIHGNVYDTIYATIYGTRCSTLYGTKYGTKKGTIARNTIWHHVHIWCCIRYHRRCCVRVADRSTYKSCFPTDRFTVRYSAQMSTGAGVDLSIEEITDLALIYPISHSLRRFLGSDAGILASS